MASTLDECAPGVTSLIGRVIATIRQWGPLSVPTLAVKIGVAPLRIRDAIDVSDELLLERDLVHLAGASTQAMVEAHLAVHGSLPLEALAMGVGRGLAAVEFACRRSRKIQLVRQSLSSSTPVHAIFQGAAR